MNQNDARHLRQLMLAHDHRAVRDYAIKFNGSTDLLVVGELPLDLAKRSGCHDCYEILIDCGADPNREGITKRMDWFSWTNVSDQVIEDFKNGVTRIPVFRNVKREFILSQDWFRFHEEQFQKAVKAALQISMEHKIDLTRSIEPSRDGALTISCDWKSTRLNFDNYQKDVNHVSEHERTMSKKSTSI